MIVIIEQDLEDHGSGRWNWKPHFFRGRWGDGRMWRLAWGLWSISYFPSPGLRKFHDHIASGRTAWTQPAEAEGRRGVSEHEPSDRHLPAELVRGPLVIRPHRQTHEPSRWLVLLASLHPEIDALIGGRDLRRMPGPEVERLLAEAESRLGVGRIGGGALPYDEAEGRGE